MRSRSTRTSHRHSRRAERRKRVVRTAAWAASVVVVIGAFVGGLVWRLSKIESAAAELAPPESSDAQRAEALRLLDEAVRARHEERTQGAANAAMAARRADPQLRGVDVLVGEIALEQKDPETLRHAVKLALERGDSESSSLLLAAIEAWMRRGEEGTDKAGQSAEQFLSDAAQAEPSNAAVYFFRGELSRLLGDGRKAHRYLLAALHRQKPWRSVALLGNKIQLAAREAYILGKSVIVSSPTRQDEAVLTLCEAVASSVSENEAVVQLVRFTPMPQALVLLDDLALTAKGEEPALNILRSPTDAGPLGRRNSLPLLAE